MRKIEMTLEEYEAFPKQLGWKVEYFDGYAYIRSGNFGVCYRLDIQEYHAIPMEFEKLRLLPVKIEYNENLVESFANGFFNTPDYYELNLEELSKKAKTEIEQYFQWEEEAIINLSRFNSLVENNKKIIAACLVKNLGNDCLELFAIWTEPEWRNIGIASSLLSSILLDAKEKGFYTLFSFSLLANESSRAWHKKIGFTELEDDLYLASYYYRYYCGELYRRKNFTKDISPSEEQSLQETINYWKKKYQKLEVIAEEKGFEEVAPLLKYFRQ